MKYLLFILLISLAFTQDKKKDLENEFKSLSDKLIVAKANMYDLERNKKLLEKQINDIELRLLAIQKEYKSISEKKEEKKK